MHLSPNTNLHHNHIFNHYHLSSLTSTSYLPLSSPFLLILSPQSSSLSLSSPFNLHVLQTPTHYSSAMTYTLHHYNHTPPLLTSILPVLPSLQSSNTNISLSAQVLSQSTTVEQQRGTKKTNEEITEDRSIRKDKRTKNANRKEIGAEEDKVSRTYLRLMLSPCSSPSPQVHFTLSFHLLLGMYTYSKMRESETPIKTWSGGPPPSFIFTFIS
ncbi:unnamed protein product [Vicia faba]|uniref:Uncharacterized protein n=1 Tax=Vicia faba TaxID=3906 RepID=A0AAV0ZJF2_VICFA|nr:unnamed protein product [Vicia faba]